MVGFHSHEAASHSHPRAYSSAAASLVFLATTVAFMGCGGSDGPERNRVSGSVTLDGQPIPHGMITFEPDATKGHTGPQGFATIRDGRFDTNESGGRGIIGGPHRVRIDGYRGEAVDPQSADPSVPTNIEVLVDKYETAVDLPKGDTTHNFAITNDDLHQPRRE